MAYDYDLFVIGAGSGGVRAARIAAGHGARVAIAEQDRVGGTCVIRGCVPKKLLVYASRFSHAFEDAAGFGWSLAAPRFDWPTLIAAKDREIARLEGLYRAGLARAGVRLIEDRAEFASPHAVRLKQADRTITAERILIATGGRPSLGPPIPGIEQAIVSDHAFHLPALPRRIAIQGGGYIAVEFASIFLGLGSEVSLICRGDRILRGFDEDVRIELEAALVRRGLRILKGRRVAAVEAVPEGRVLVLDDGARLVADQVMFAIGRHPNTEGLGLAAAGVTCGERGEIRVDAASRTSVSHIFAVGDVSGRVALTPAAIREGHAFADTLFGKRAWTADLAWTPTAVFATPEAATVGEAEHEARARGASIDIYKTSFRPMLATLSGREERVMMKLVVEQGTGLVLGCHMVGEGAAEIVQMAAIALRMRATKDDFDAAVALHPTAAEELVTLREVWRPPA